MPTSFSISGGTMVSPSRVRSGSSIRIDGATIASIGRSRAAVSKLDVRVPEGTFVFPALLNIHDHMRGNYLPRVGPSGGRYYTVWSDWNNDLQASATVAERNRTLSISDIYALSSYKNILSGVATVHDHFPHEWNEPFVSRQPLTVVREYTLAHDASRYALPWGGGVQQEHRAAKKNGWPFITHLEEGFDAEVQAGVDALDRMRCLDDHTVMIHCIGFSEEDIHRVAHAGAHVAWCAASNMYMFNTTCRVRSMLEHGVNVSIGTDSTHTGAINLFDEIRFARRTYRQMYNQDIEARTLVEMVTTNPARALRLDGVSGCLAHGARADVLIIDPRHDDPHESLVAARPGDIELLTSGGRPLFGSLKFEEVFATANLEEFGGYTHVGVEGKQKLVTGDPLSMLRQLRQALGYHKDLEFLPVELPRSSSSKRTTAATAPRHAPATRGRAGARRA